MGRASATTTEYTPLPHDDREDFGVQNEEQGHPDQPGPSRAHTYERIEPVFDQLGRTYSLRRKSRWLPYYEVGNKKLNKPCYYFSATINCCFCTFAFIGVVAVIALITGFLVTRRERWWSEWGLPGNIGDGIAHYPTDFTRDVEPVPCHSHNDYWRNIPLYEAIHYGCTSTEADVWKYGNELFVGHVVSALTPNRTFRNMYVNPLVDILDRQNRPNKLDKRSHGIGFRAQNPKIILESDDSLNRLGFLNPTIPLASTTTKNGVFDRNLSQTLVLLVDFKIDGDVTYYAVQKQLGALRERGYLTYWNGREIIPGPVTVVLTGVAPFQLVVANNTYRDMFFDAPIQEFSAKSPTIAHKIYNYTNSYYASQSLFKVVGYPWRGRYSSEQIEKMSDHIKGAQLVGLKARYWDTPAWPISIRNYAWEVLFKEGNDMLNVDDIYFATHGKWGKWT